MAQSASGYKAPGRLGDPNMTLATEPRLDARLRAMLKQMGLLDSDFLSAPRKANPSIEDLTPGMETNHHGTMKLYEMLPNDLPGDEDEPEVSITTKSCPAPDGAEIKLHVFRSKGSEGKPLPGLLYIHGGGMVILDTRNKVHDRWATSLAAQGLVVVVIEYRNAWSPSGPNHYPIGLNDCAAGVKYIAAHRADFGITYFVLQGESGGGNLSLATTLKAKREGWVNEIAGVWASVPYISGAYGWPQERMLAELPSLVECNGYFLETGGMADMVYYYGPKKEDLTDPLAWPYHVSVEEMKGLPPHVISVDELDPLRDEGIIYYRRLLEAGVPASGRVNLGLVHGAELAFRKAMPDVVHGVVRDIAAFAKSFSPSSSATKL